MPGGEVLFRECLGQKPACLSREPDFAAINQGVTRGVSAAGIILPPAVTMGSSSTNWPRRAKSLLGPSAKKADEVRVDHPAEECDTRRHRGCQAQSKSR